jgi:hypothetical protein
MENFTDHWCEFFSLWPADLPRRGIIVTGFNEQIVFSSFSTSKNFLFIERQTPDSLGARSIITTYNQIIAVKITDVIKPKTFKAVAFDSAGSKN